MAQATAEVLLRRFHRSPPERQQPMRSMRRCTAPIGLSGIGRIVVLIAGVLLAGCDVSPSASSAADAAVGFLKDVQAGDGTAACALLAASTIEELESTSKAGCSTAVLAEDLPSASQVLRSAAFGSGAQVVLDGDVLFLTVQDGGWKVTAAGCTSRPDRPYLCVVSGG